MELTRPTQISSVPQIDAGALSAVNGSFDTLERLLGNVHAIVFGENTLSFAAAATSSSVVLTNIRGLQTPSGYLTPKAVFTGISVVGVGVSCTSLGPGAATFLGWTTTGANTTETDTFWYLLIA